MNRILLVLDHAFPLLALTGLLLVGWGLLNTPDEFQQGQEISQWAWSFKSKSYSSDMAP